MESSTIGHAWSNHVEDKIRKLYPDSKITFRHYDLTETTDDPGNTELYISYVNCESVDVNDMDEAEIEASMLEDEGSGGPGDYEEFEIFTQNNELVIIINSNK